MNCLRSVWPMTTSYDRLETDDGNVVSPSCRTSKRRSKVCGWQAALLLSLLSAAAILGNLAGRNCCSAGKNDLLGEQFSNPKSAL